MANLKPALATTYMAKNLEFRLTQILAHLKSGSPREELTDSFPMLFKVVAYIADASAKSVHMSAGSSALANSARRALKLKTLRGDSATKLQLCGLPITGDLLFGPELDSILVRTADNKKSFPEVKKKAVSKQFFQGLRGRGKTQGQIMNWQSQKGRGKNSVLFNPPTAASRPSDSLATVGGRLGEFLTQWQAIKPSPFVLFIIEKGYELEFVFPLPQGS